MSEKTYTLSRDLVRVICPSCADKMEASHIAALKLSADDIGTLFPGDETTIKLFSGFSQGLCNKFGGDEGFFTRCAETMAGKVEDEKGFCASLHKFCVGKWPAEKDHALSESELTAYEKAYAEGNDGQWFSVLGKEYPVFVKAGA